jgi:hypothetical protein
MGAFDLADRSTEEGVQRFATEGFDCSSERHLGSRGVLAGANRSRGRRAHQGAETLRISAFR